MATPLNQQAINDVRQAAKTLWRGIGDGATALRVLKELGGITVDETGPHCALPDDEFADGQSQPPNTSINNFPAAGSGFSDLTKPQFLALFLALDAILGESQGDEKPARNYLPDLLRGKAI